MVFAHPGRKKHTIFEGSSTATSKNVAIPFDRKEPIGLSGKESIRIFPMGGIGNVTKNMFVYEYRYDGKIRDIMLVDCGIGFPDAEMYGVDLVLPDIRYLEDKKQYIP